MPTILGLIYVALAVILLLRRGYHWVLSLALAAPVGVIASIGGGEGIPVFHFLGIGALAAAIVASGKRGKETAKRPGAVVLVALVWVSGIVTLLAPTLFPRVQVLIASQGIDNQLADPGYLAYTTSNLAQMAYLIIGIGVVFYLGGIKKLPSGFLSPGLALVTALCFIRLLSVNYGTPWLPRFFDNSQSVAYIETFAGGKERFRGVFAEPSELAASALVTIVYSLTRLPLLRPSRRFWALIVLCMAAANLWSSTSGTAIAAGCALVGLIGGIWFVQFFSGQWRIPLRGALAGLTVFSAAIATYPLWSSAIWKAIESKMDSSSFTVRTQSDAFSLGVFMDTWGLGSGLGSNRPSTFLPMLLSNIGVAGTVLFLAAVFILGRRAWRDREMRPVVWAFFALMVSKSIAGPNFSEPLIWLMLGMFANAAWKQADPEKLAATIDATSQGRPVSKIPRRYQPA